MIDFGDFGSCCTCGTTVGVVNFMMLPYRGPTPGKGWGCVVCGLPADGAVAVLCDTCVESGRPIKFICTGYPNKDGRTPTDDTGVLTPFDHDMTKHPEG